MYHVTRVNTDTVTSPAGYARHSVGFRRQDVVSNATGSVHMNLSLCALDADGRIDPVVHSYEKSLYVLDGTLVLSMLGESMTMRQGHCALVPVGVVHELRATVHQPARWLEMTAPAQMNEQDSRSDTFFIGSHNHKENPGSVDLRDPRNRHYFRFDDSSMDLMHLARGSAIDAPAVSASMSTALLAYSGIGVRMLVDQRLGAQLHTMFMVEYQPTAAAHPHDHPFEEAYFFLEGEVEAHVAGDVLHLGPGDVLWAGVGCDHGFYNRTDQRVRWIETQAPQPPARHSYRFNRDWEYLADTLASPNRPTSR